MTDTDVTLYKLNTSYAAIQRNYGTHALELSLDHPAAGTDLRVVSGYWRRMYSCTLDGFIYRLRESQWTWKDSVRYTSSCDVIGGTSGSPVITVHPHIGYAQETYILGACIAPGSVLDFDRAGCTVPRAR